MKTSKKFLALIPARSGSKGIPDKNIRAFCGRPLIYYAISEAKKSKYLDRIVVSTDSPKYAAIAKKYGAEVPFLRPKRLAGDKSGIIDTVVDVLNKLKTKENYEPDYLVLLQTTSPLRKASDIDECIEKMLETKSDGAMTFTSTEQLLYKIEKNRAKLLFNKNWIKYTNRQSLPSTYKINGPAVVIGSVRKLLKKKSFLVGKIAPFVMEKWRSPDLDNEEDFLLAEMLYKKRKIFGF